MYKRYLLTFVIIIIICVLLSACNVQANTPAESDVSTLTSGNAVDCDVIRMLTFGGYREYLDFVREATPESINADLYGVYRFGDKAIADILAIQNAKEGVLVPCYKGIPIALRNEYDPISVTDGGWYYLTWTEFFARIGDRSAKIKLSRLSDKHRKMADDASGLISAISPSAVNVDNYRNYESELLVYEDTAVIDGVSTSVMVRQTVYGNEMIHFVTNGYLVVIDASVGAITPEWLGEFSLGACPEEA